MDNHSVIKGLIAGDKELSSAFNSIKGNVSGSKLIDDILAFLLDDNQLLRGVTDKNKIALVSLMKKYFTSCGKTFIVESGMDKLATACKSEIYNIQTFSGLRVATVREIKEGVRGLVAVDKFPIGEEKYRLINLLVWTITGRLGNYSKAGYKYNYDKQLGLTDTVYQLIARSAKSLTDMMDWVGNKEEFSSDMDTVIKAAKKKYKYPEYATDEVREDIKANQVIYYLKTNIPKDSSDKEYRKALSIILRLQENKYYKPSPVDISFLRGVHSRLKDGSVSSANTQKEEDTELRIMCEKIEQAEKAGIINSNHFAFKIISTLRKSNFSSCSVKQHEIIVDALNKIEPKKETKAKEEVEVPVYDYSDDELNMESLMDISNALGDGIFED